MTRTRWMIVAAAVVLILLGGLTYEVIATAPVRGAVRTCAELFSAANRPGLKPEQRIAAAQALCTRRYLQTPQARRRRRWPGARRRPAQPQQELQGLAPWSDVWICPTNRIGPVYQFVLEDGAWRFDGPVGILRAWGEMIPMEDVPGLE